MTDQKETIISAERLTVGYGKKTVLSDLCFELKKGEITALIGENGCGKSTLLKTIIGEIPVISGNIMIGGVNAASLSSRDMAKLMAIVMTGSLRTEYFTCYDAVASGRYPYTGRFGRLSSADDRKIKEAMALTGVEEISGQYITDISDGQRQLVMLSRAIAQEPKMLILDEPTNFLDIRHKMLFAGTVKKLAKENGISVLMSIHELELVRKMADRVIALKDKAIDASGSADDILTDDYIRKLFRLDQEKSLEPG
ncbi:MAG: ABC transporter ATP-binding protein [Lachnospiraceae bacterium]|nr:ABC transporter ATP-binding protein [Lachnospiraceae bacterium]